MQQLNIEGTKLSPKEQFFIDSFKIFLSHVISMQKGNKGYKEVVLIQGKDKAEEEKLRAVKMLKKSCERNKIDFIETCNKNNIKMYID